ncbi:MAG: ATP synthase F1 subunit delta [Chitinophagales bacterium]
MQNRVVAGRYAAALFRTAVARGEMERVERDLALLVSTLGAEESLRRFLDSPMNPLGAKKELLGKVFGDKISLTVRNFLFLLVDKKRHEYLGAIAELYREHVNAARGITVAKVRSAQPLTPQVREAIRAKLRNLTGREIELEEQIDASVVGGVYLRVGNRVIDYTIQKQLEELREGIATGRINLGGKAARKRVQWKKEQ